jgi:hypothetical protein
VAGLGESAVLTHQGTMLSGEEVGDSIRGQKLMTSNVWSAPATRANLDSLRQLPADTPGDPHGFLPFMPSRVAQAQWRDLAP